MNSTSIKFLVVMSILLILAVSGCSRTPKPSDIRLDPTKAQFHLAAVDLAAPATMETVSSGGEQTFILHVQMSDAKKDAFRRFTRDHTNQQIQLVVGTEVIAEPFIGAEIQDGRMNLNFSSSEQARRGKYLLAKR